MKRIFWLLAVSALFLCACNKDKDKGDGPLVINPYDLVGVWVCTDNINPTGEHLPNVAALTSMVVSINSLTHYAPYYGSDDHKFEFTSINVSGDKLVLDEGKETETVFYVKELDGKHLKWIQYLSNEVDIIQESYINATRILPGTWKVNYPDGYTTATIDAKGNFVEEYHTEVPQILNCEWLLYNKDGHVVLWVREVLKDDSLWDTEFTILSITDNRIETKQSVSDATVVFERQ